MESNQKKTMTDIVNAFRLLNGDLRESFKIMSDKLDATSDFSAWKKYEKSIKPSIEDYRDWDDFIKGNDNWYYLNYYGLYEEKVVGFTFVISVDYDKESDVDYYDFINKLDGEINKNSPLLCIAGVYSLIDDNIKKAKFLKDETWTYVDDILQFTGDCKNYNIDDISYEKWISIEMDYEKNGEVKGGFEGWYKEASINIVNITDISSKEKAEKIIDDLIHQVKTDIKQSSK
ncbi:hypothetical protein KJ877_07385 [bacterium]|nr:hypothetical protein [bacterium]MBU1989668.1 hypothetical protein [bacterium]